MWSLCQKRLVLERKLKLSSFDRELSKHDQTDAEIKTSKLKKYSVELVTY